MADTLVNTIHTRISLKYDTYSNWTINNPVLLAGEVAIVVVPSETGAVAKEPATLFKVGNGTDAFNTLPFAAGLAADVYDWAKTAEKPVYTAEEIEGLATYIGKKVEDTNTTYKIEVDANNARKFSLYRKELSESTWTLDTTVEIPETVYTLTTGDTNGTVKFNGNEVAVAGLGSAAFTNSNAYDASGTAATAKAEAISAAATDATDKAAQALADAKTYADGLASNYDVSGAAATVQGETESTIKDVEDALATHVSTAASTYATKTEAQEYADAKDTAIADAKKAGTDAAAAAAQVASDLTAEVTARENADSALDSRVQELEGKITGLSGAMHFVGVKEILPEDVSSYAEGDVIIVGEKEYVFDGTEFVEFGDVSAEAERIAAIEKDYLTSADKTELTGAITTAKNDAISTAAADATTKANDAQAAAEATAAADATSKADAALASAKTYTDTAKADAISTAATDAATKAAAAEANAKAYADDLADNYDATGSAAQALTDAKAYADSLAVNYDAAGSANNVKAALETEITKKANSSDLATIAKTGNVEDLVQTANTYIVFNCGSSSSVI